MANTKVTGDVIANGTISTVHLADNAITSDKITGITTAHITEGSNLYYTDGRVRAAISVNGNALSYDSSTGVITSNYEESPTFTGNITFGDSHFIGDDADDNLLIQSSANENIIINSVDDLFLRTGGTTKLIVKNSGNVGIGVTSPSQKLHVNGNTILGGALYVSSDGNYNTNSAYTFRDAVYINNPNSTSAAVSSNTVMSIGAMLGNSVTTSLITTGAVGIGTTSPSSLLHLKKATLPRIALTKTGILDWFIGNPSQGTSNNFTIGTNSGSNTEILTITNTANVGIGVTSPIGKLQVGSHTFTGGNAVYTDSRIGSYVAGSLTSMVYASTYNDPTYPDYGMVFIHGPSASSYNVWSISPDGPAKGDSLNFIYGANASNIHTTTPKVVFDGNGNVGIGTTSPGYKLEVAGTAGINSNLNMSTGAEIRSSDGYGIRLRNAANSANEGGFVRSGLWEGDSSRDPSLFAETGLNLRFYTGGSANERMFIDSNGNVAIGTTSPSQKLHVIGNIYATGRTQSANALIGSQTISSTAFATLGSNSSGIGIAIARDHAPSSYPDIIINSSGNVGIGTASQTRKLEVAGDLRVDGLSSGTSVSFGGTGDFGIDAPGVGGGRFIVKHSSGNVGIGVANPQFEKLEVAGNIKANDVNGKFYTNAYVLGASDTYVDTVTVTGTCLYEYTIAVNPNTAGSGAYTDYYYGKVGIGIGWNGSTVTQYIFQDADETAPRSLYPSGGGNISISIRMIYSGGVYTELAANTTAVIRFQGFSTSNTGIIYLRRLA